MFPLHPSLQPQSEGIDENLALSSLKYKPDFDRRLPLQMQMQMEQYKQSLARVDLRHDAERLPVVWRWTPSTSQNRPQNLSGSLDTLNPRIIHATSKSIDFSKNDRPIDSSHLLTGAELLEARELLKESSTLAPQTNETLSSVHQKLHRTANQDGGLEAAKMLLNMVENSDTKEKQTSSTQKLPISKTKSTTKAKKPSALNTISPLQDEYLSKWMSGSISLHTPEDDDVLSPLHCFMRRYCVEAFSATDEDVATPRYGKSHGFKVTVGQVGIRCLHCKHLPLDKRAERAVCYPSSLKNIYHSIETWQRRHSSVCKHITPWVRKSILDLMEKSKTRAGGRRQYWEDSARRLGMVDTSRGVRFCRKPADLGPIRSPELCQLPGDQDTPGHKPEPIVREEDKDLVTEYLYLLMDQMQSCRFVEADRIGGRSKIKDNEVGFPGMECKHCQGRAGFGRYFPTSVAALSLANSDRNVYNHLLKCRRCPEKIKADLTALQKNQNQAKNRRGLRKLFFARLWKRIHKDEKSSHGKTENGGTEKTQAKPESQFVPYTGYNGNSKMHAHPRVVVNNFRRF